MLESPTGTGKTMSLLCASLAWLTDMRSQGSKYNHVKIYYCSRTHTQLTQVVQQLKRTAYQPKIVVLGSRDQSCVN